LAMGKKGQTNLPGISSHTAGIHDNGIYRL